MIPKMILEDRIEQAVDIMNKTIQEDWSINKCMVVAFDPAKFHIEVITRARVRLHSNGWATDVIHFLRGDLIAVFIAESDTVIKRRLK